MGCSGYIDGYGFGEQLLEGVIFKIETNDDSLTVSVLSEYQKYFSTLNEKKWMDAAKDYAMVNDLFSSKPDMNDDLVVLFDTTKPYHSQSFGCPEEIKIDDVLIQVNGGMI